MEKVAMMVELHSRTLREPHEESGTYVATLTPETTQQHIDRREISSPCPQVRATRSFDGDTTKLLLDHRLEYCVHFRERRNAHSSHHRRMIMQAGESALTMTKVGKVLYTATNHTTGGRVNSAARSSDVHRDYKSGQE
jgi:hypothetical protein